MCINSVKCPLGRRSSDVPKPPEIPAEIAAEVATLHPGAPGKWLQRIGNGQRQQILKLDFCEREPFIYAVIGAVQTAWMVVSLSTFRALGYRLLRKPVAISPNESNSTLEPLTRAAARADDRLE